MYKKTVTRLLALCAALLLCSCSDDGNGKDTPGPDSKVTDRMTASLPAQPVSSWAQGDETYVMTLETSRQNLYTLSEGAGKSTGTFMLTSGTASVVEVNAPLHAYTPSKYIEGIWANKNSQAEMGHRIPRAYTASEVGCHDGIVPRPVAYYGPAVFGSDSVLHASFHQLTATLSIPVSAIPAGSSALVLVTHPRYTVDNQTITGGSSEPLSGLFTTVLQDGAQLREDDDFMAYDTLRVNLTGLAAYDRLCIPVIAGTYSRLSVIAVTEDTYYDYEWKGTELKAFTNRTVAVGDVLE